MEKHLWVTKKRTNFFSLYVALQMLKSNALTYVFGACKITHSTSWKDVEKHYWGGGVTNKSLAFLVSMPDVEVTML